MRILSNRPRTEIRPRRRPVSQMEVELARHRAWVEASLPRASL